LKQGIDKSNLISSILVKSYRFAIIKCNKNQALNLAYLAGSLK
jgi:hypothetical protein